MAPITERAERLKQLHADRKPLVLPTVWDAWSARTAAAAGFEALTIGSHPLADSRGAEDHEGQTLEEVVARRADDHRLGRRPRLDRPRGRVRPRAGRRDRRAARGRWRRPQPRGHRALRGRPSAQHEEHAAYIAGLREAADGAGVPVWINGRTDLFLHAGDDPQAVRDEAIERMRALVEAGADSVYPVRIQDDDELITAVVAAVAVPVNCTAHPVKHDLARFRRLGVGRITYGPLLQFALTDAMNEMIAAWR